MLITKTNDQNRTIFLHAAAGYPTVSTFCKAIDAGFFATWPNLTSALARKHLHNVIPTIMGRLKHTRKGLRSTRQIPPPIITEDSLDPLRSHTDRRNEIGVSAFQLDEIDGLICTDLPGRFPFISSRVNNYIFIMYDFDSNAILAEPFKSRKTKHFIKGFIACHKRITAAVITPILLRPDNEIYSDLIDAIHSKNLKYQLANAYDHRHNLANRQSRHSKLTSSQS